MLKRLILSLALCVAMATPALADSTGLYAGAKFIYNYQSTWGGGLFTNSQSQSILGGGFFAGYNFYTKSDLPIRAEVEYAFRGNMYQDDSGPGYDTNSYFNMQTLLANVYYDFYNESDFTPYVGAGLGAAFYTGEYHFKAGNNKYNGSMDDTVLAWNVGGGVGYAINEQITADLGYRYLGTSSSYKEVGGADLETSTSGHEISLGVRFNF